MSERKRRLFTPEFKREAVRQITEGGKSLAQAAADLGVRPDMLEDWMLRLRNGSAPERVEPKEPNARRDEEIRRLRYQLLKARNEVAFLRRVAMYFARSQPERFVSGTTSAMSGGISRVCRP
jgi:transposase